MHSPFPVCAQNDCKRTPKEQTVTGEEEGGTGQVGDGKKALTVQTFSYILISDPSVKDSIKNLNIRGSWVVQ